MPTPHSVSLSRIRVQYPLPTLHLRRSGRLGRRRPPLDRRRTRAKFGAVLGALAFALVVASVTLVPVGRAAFPGANGKIAFGSFRDGNFEIYVMNADGSNQTNLTNNPASDQGPSWSPDGTKIAFFSGRDDPSTSEVYVMNADGSSQTRLTFITNGWPAWSPDGTKITFTSNQGPNPFPGEIYVMNADGTGATRLTNNSATDQVSDWQPVCNVIGTEGNDFRAGGSGNDLICGLGGDDALLGLAGSDRIFGHAGSDAIFGGGGGDLIVGGDGQDALFGGLGNDTVQAKDGQQDFVSCGDGLDQVTADPNDIVVGCETVSPG